VMQDLSPRLDGWEEIAGAGAGAGALDRMLAEAVTEVAVAIKAAAVIEAAVAIVQEDRTSQKIMVWTA